MRHGLAVALLAAVSFAGAGHAGCAAIGARYVPRDGRPAPDIRYRMTILPPPSGTALMAERYRFELFSRRTGRRLSRLDLDMICGNGRLPCATWQPGTDADSIFHSIVIKLNADFTPVLDWSAAHAIIFPNFSENDWTTAMALHRMSNVRYYTVPHVEPDLSDQTIWLRSACGRG